MISGMIAGLVVTLLFIVWISAVVLFLKNLKPFKWISMYFFFSHWANCVCDSLVVRWATGLLSGLSFYDYYRNYIPNAEFTSTKYDVYPGMSGFIDECLLANDVYERKLLLEHKIESVNISSSDSLSFQEGDASLNFYLSKKSKPGNTKSTV